jgi:TonB family protein
MGLLPQKKFNYKTLLAAFALQSAFVVLLVRTGIIQTSAFITPSDSVTYVHLSKPVKATPKITPKTTPRATPRPRVLEPTPQTVAPLTIPRMIVTKEPPKVKPAPTPSVEAPSVSLPSKGLALPNETATRPSFAPPGVFDGVGSGAGDGSGSGRDSSGSKEGGSTKDGNSDAGVPAGTPIKPKGTETSAVTITYRPKPAYTEEARRFGITGEVLLQVNFSASGRVHVLRVLTGLGHGLDEQAVIAAEQIRFLPAKENGESVDREATVHVTFDLAR